MGNLSYLARVLASLILHSYQNYALCFASRFPLFHSGPMEWNEEHDVLFLREMLARNISSLIEIRSLISLGSSFQNLGAATKNDPSPRFS